MSSGNQARNGNVVRRTDRSRRIWYSREEDVLIASLKELVANGWKSDNGFRVGYLGKLEEAMKKEFPDTDIKAIPHITSKLNSWKRNYYSLMAMLSRSGVGFNSNGTYMIDCDNEQWDQIVKMDANARGMRFKSWPMLDEWKEIFGKDRATGEGAEGIMDAVNEMLQEENRDTADAYYVNRENILEEDVDETSVCQRKKAEDVQKGKGKKRKVVDGMEGVVEFMGEISRNTNARLDTIATRIGYEYDLAQARKDVFEQLGNIPGLSLNEKFDVCEILAGKDELMQMWLGMPAEAKPEYVQRLLLSKHN